MFRYEYITGMLNLLIEIQHSWLARRELTQFTVVRRHFLDLAHCDCTPEPVTTIWFYTMFPSIRTRHGRQGRKFWRDVEVRNCINQRKREMGIKDE